jgi:hypothetical protein
MSCNYGICLGNRPSPELVHVFDGSRAASKGELGGKRPADAGAELGSDAAVRQAPNLFPALIIRISGGASMPLDLLAALWPDCGAGDCCPHPRRGDSPPNRQESRITRAPSSGEQDIPAKRAFWRIQLMSADPLNAYRWTLGFFRGKYRAIALIATEREVRITGAHAEARRGPLQVQGGRWLSLTHKSERRRTAARLTPRRNWRAACRRLVAHAFARTAASALPVALTAVTVVDSSLSRPGARRRRRSEPPAGVGRALQGEAGSGSLCSFWWSHSRWVAGMS